MKLKKRHAKYKPNLREVPKYSQFVYYFVQTGKQFAGQHQFWDHIFLQLI